MFFKSYVTGIKRKRIIFFLRGSGSSCQRKTAWLREKKRVKKNKLKKEVLRADGENHQKLRSSYQIAEKLKKKRKKMSPLCRRGFETLTNEFFSTRYHR